MEQLEFLTREQIKKAAPSVFTTSRFKDLSDKYVHIPTDRIIEDMEVMGWKVSKAVEVRARRNKGFQKHMLVFRNPEVVIEGADGDTVLPQILVSNSHDGKNSFQFTAGLFRMVCSNGLVIAAEEFESRKIRHMGYSFEEVQKVVMELVEQLPVTIEIMNKFKSTTLTDEQKHQLAKEAIATRFPGLDKTQDVVKAYQIDLDEILKPVRKEDEGNDLWNVFNVIQEKVLEGDFEYISGVKMRKARRIKNFKQDMKLNKELYEIASQFVEG
jgi:hypothetical protein